MQATAKKTRFDYRAACLEVAEPAVRALPEPVLALYRELRDAEAFDKLAQGRDLDVPMPDALRDRFAGLDTETLARASWALYHFGHWSGKLDADKPDTRGATWKFSNLADQVLRTRLQLPNRGSSKSIGYHFEIHEGALRLCASTPDSWTWIELGPATENFLASARAWRSTLRGCPATPYLRSSESWRAFETAAFEATREVPETLLAQLSPDWRNFVTCGKRYTREEGKCSDDCPECGTSQLFKSAAANHSLKCSQYPLEARIEAVLRHGETFGLTPAQLEAARAAILATK